MAAEWDHLSLVAWSGRASGRVSASSRALVASANEAICAHWVCRALCSVQCRCSLDHSITWRPSNNRWAFVRSSRPSRAATWRVRPRNMRVSSADRANGVRPPPIGYLRGPRSRGCQHHPGSRCRARGRSITPGVNPLSAKARVRSVRERHRFILLGAEHRCPAAVPHRSGAVQRSASGAKLTDSRQMSPKIPPPCSFIDCLRWGCHEASVCRAVVMFAITARAAFVCVREKQ